MMREFCSGCKTLALAGLILAYGVWSACSLPLQTDLFSLFPQDLPSLRALRSLQKDSSVSQQVFLIQGPEGKWTAEYWELFRTALEGEVGEIPQSVTMPSSSVLSPQTSQWIATALASLPPEVFQRMRSRLEPAALEQRERALREARKGAFDEVVVARSWMDPFGLLEDLDSLRIPGAEKKSTFIALTITHPSDSFDECQALERTLRRVIEKSLKASALNSSDFPVLLTGEAIFTSQISTQMQRDLQIMLAFTISLVLLLFWVVYRSWKPLGWILLVQALSISCALIVARHFLGGINVITMGFASILMGVSLDYCILVYHHFARGELRQGSRWKLLVRGIWFSALATATAFGVLVFSQFPGLQQLALLVATGLIASAAFSTTLLAWALSQWPPHQPPEINRMPRLWGMWIEQHSRKILFGVVVFAVVLGMGMIFLNSQTLYDDDIARLQPSSLEAYRAHELLKAQLPVSNPKSIPLEANRSQWTSLSPKTWEILQATKTPAADLSRAVVSWLDRWHQNPETLRAHTPGAQEWAQLRSDLDAVAQKDFKILSILMLLLMGGICAWAQRSIRLVGMNALALLLALGCLILVLGFLQLPLTLVSLVCIPLLIGVVVDYSMHLLLGLEHDEGSLPKAFEHLLIPIGMTGLTSLIGFTAPALSSQPALINFGWVMDVGILCAMVTVLLLLPAFYVAMRGTQKSHYSQMFYVSWAFEAGRQIARVLPRSVIRGIGAAAGSIYARTHSQKAAVVTRNLQLLFPVKGQAPEAGVVYSQFGRNMADYFHVGSRPLPEALLLLKERIGYEHLLKVHQEGRGALLVTPHLSLFELGGMLLSSFGFKSTALTIPEPTPELTAWRASFRKQWGVETTEVGQDAFSAVSILNAFRENHFVIALIDRPLARYNSPVAFPGGSVPFASGILLMASVAQCPVLVGTIHETPERFYRAEVHAPFLIEPHGSREETLQFYADRIGNLLLPTLQAYPEQWFQFTELQASKGNL